jgi:putative transposase
MELYGWCIMTSHVHMIIGTHDEALENIIRDMKRHTSERLREAIKNHPAESRLEWILWMMEGAGKKNSNFYRAGT